MKKVRSLAGFAGLAPAAVAFIAPAAAHAATQTPATRPANTAKTVSLHHTRVRPDSGCPKPRKEFHWHNNHVSESAWVSDSGCIGTVVIKIYGSNVGECFSPRLHIYSPNSGGSTFTWAKHCSPDLDTITEGIYGYFNFPIGIYAQGYNPALGVIAGPAGGTIHVTSIS